MHKVIQTVIDEFRTLSPDISKVIVFKKDGETLAASKETTPEQTQTLIVNLNSITHTECIGGMENLAIQDVNSQLIVTAIGDAYLATLSSRLGDQKVINSITKVVGPTIIRLAQGRESISAVTEKPRQITETTKQPTEDSHIKESKIEPKIESPPSTETVPDQTPIAQFIVERISGFLVPSDTVRLDSEVLAKWQTFCNGKEISVSIETLEGKQVTCKVKSQKMPLGIIGIPDKILQMLDCSKGTLVKVKPSIK